MKIRRAATPAAQTDALRSSLLKVTVTEMIGTTEIKGVRPIAQPLTRPIRLGVLISGGGTTLVNFLRKIELGKLRAEVPIVIGSRPDCGGLDHARIAGIRAEVVSRKTCTSVEDFSDRIFSLLREAKVDLVPLAGFLSLIRIPDDFANRVLNIHNALIPSFCGKGMYGLKVHRAALARGAKVSGCTVHFADNIYDHGPIIVQKAVPVAEGDTPETLAARVFEAECEAYPEAIRLFAEGRLEIVESTVRISGG
jgi:phosphoribosylglycinamide formyltransferase 1